MFLDYPKNRPGNYVKYVILMDISTGTSASKSTVSSDTNTCIGIGASPLPSNSFSFDISESYSNFNNVIHGFFFS